MSFLFFVKNLGSRKINMYFRLPPVFLALAVLVSNIYTYISEKETKLHGPFIIILTAEMISIFLLFFIDIESL